VSGARISRKNYFKRMFRHKGKSRTYIHNLRLASILSFIAGIVNVTGVLAIKTLTTNVTGHFAYFADELISRHYTIAFVFLIFIFSFLLGAFTSNLLIEIVFRRKPAISHVVPMIIEITILSIVGIFGSSAVLSSFNGQIVACSLLFAMGIQNSLVTKVSSSVVRTTHLTGLFTDLGIELSQLFFYRQPAEFKTLCRSIYLRLTIIFFFFVGCITGGFIFKSFEIKTLLLATGCLIIALFYDNIRYRYYNLKRKVQS
jgi:uncharacterized membrane protein YoaK (UPF0700 family)